MTTVFSDPIFVKSTLTTADGKSIICTLKDQSGRYLADLIRNDSKGFCNGYLISPTITPSWMVPGTVLYGAVNGLKGAFTVEPTIQSNIAGLDKILGHTVRFSYVAVNEFV